MSSLFSCSDWYNSQAQSPAGPLRASSVTHRHHRVIPFIRGAGVISLLTWRDPHSQILSCSFHTAYKLLIPEDGVVKVSMASKLLIIYVHFSLQVAASMGRDTTLLPTSTFLPLILHCLRLFCHITWDSNAFKSTCSLLGKQTKMGSAQNSCKILRKSSKLQYTVK